MLNLASTLILCCPTSFLWEETEMSLFDYPRINVKGTIQLNPGTANNDDYAGAVSFPAE